MMYTDLGDVWKDVPKYLVGTRLDCNEVQGTVVKNCKMPGDICVQWDNGQFSSYDQEWLDENAKIMKK